ncbi:uncharacterized protein [Parasteatoda tepidariorum]|nr:uncharacterized protein LOC107440907 isoform X2 [Parasteatoda tepidariorum]
MIELEKEAQQRVKQMEKRLKNSAKTTMEAVINMHEYEKEIKRLVEERIYIESVYKDSQQHLTALKVENGFLRDQNSNLNHDVQALLHVIHHARSTGHWEMDCVTFCEVTPEQVFGPVQSISHNDGTDTDSQLYNRDSKKMSTNSDIFSQDTASIYTSSPHHSRVRSKGKANLSPVHLLSSCLPRCASLPEIGNIYNFNQAVHKSNSYDTNGNKRLLGFKSSKHKRIGARNAIQTPELLKDVSCVENLEERLCNRKGQSEPHLFMFDGNIYKYTPCEPIKKASSNALCENYQSSLPPYQSIDLKFPTEGSTLKVNIWNKLKSGSYLDDQENSYLKDNSTDSSCSCSESEITGLNQQMCRLFGEQCNMCVHSENKVSKFSVGLQAEADRTTQGTQFILNDIPNILDECPGRDVVERSLIQNLKEDLNKAIIRIEEKSVLLDQLQNHVDSVMKQVELKDTALENLERKLQNSRQECSVFEKKLDDLSSTMQVTIKNYEESCIEIEKLKLQVEQQSYIIRNLQDALVQSKRAFDAAHLKVTSPQGLNSETVKTKNHQTSKSAIVDI